jgi:hypothetical protein
MNPLGGIVMKRTKEKMKGREAKETTCRRSGQEKE